MIKYKIIDNFLATEDHEKIHYTLCESANFPWFFYNYVLSENMDKKNESNIMLRHVFYQAFFNQETIMEISPQINLLKPLLWQIHPASLIRLTANLYPKTEQKMLHGFHKDFQYESWTAVYYVNTNNGYTILQDEVEIESIANRLLVFPTTTMHSPTTCTDQKSRVVVNVNFF
jgi:hypothetical protein